MMEVIKEEDAKSTAKMKAYQEGFQQVQTIVHLSNLWATSSWYVKLMTLNKHFLEGNLWLVFA